MALTTEQAESIAALLNARNVLTVSYDKHKVLKEDKDYLLRSSPEGKVIACVQLKKVQWYQCEVLHLTVDVEHERQGHAKTLLKDCEVLAHARHARILQCTIRSDNTASKCLFQSFGFVKVSAFLNEVSGNNVEVWQKVLATTK